MKHFARRKFLHLTAAVAALPVLSRMARPQAYPARPVRIIVGFAAGGPADIAARLIGRWLSERLGKQFVIENRPGAAGSIATETAVNAPADGYTLLQVSGSNTINAALYENLSFNFSRDIVPIAGMMRATEVMLVNPSFGPKTVPEFIAFAKANPGKINMGSGGTGSVSHMAGELFKASADVNLVHVPYRGEALALNDLLGAQIQILASWSLVNTYRLKRRPGRHRGEWTAPFFIEDWRFRPTSLSLRSPQSRSLVHAKCPRPAKTVCQFVARCGSCAAAWIARSAQTAQTVSNTLRRVGGWSRYAKMLGERG